MAFFKFRVPGAKVAGTDAAALQSESVEAMRRRARHRLIGAFVLVMVAVIGFPLVFDTQPRPVAVDVDIQIPDRARSGPLQLPASAATAASATEVKPSSTVTPAVVASAPAARASQVAAPASLDPREELVSADSAQKPAKPSAAASSVAIKKEEKSAPPPVKPEAKEPARAEAKAASKPVSDDGARARALLEGKDLSKAPPSAAADAGRFIVQIGAFADSDKARETRMKVERAGLTTYTQVIETPEGKRTRVRVGPFSNRAEAEKAASKIRSLDLSAAILTL